MKIGFLELAEIATIVVSAFAIGMCVGAFPGARRINDMPASAKRLNAGTAIGAGAVAAFWFLFVFG